MLLLDPDLTPGSLAHPPLTVVLSQRGGSVRTTQAGHPLLFPSLPRGLGLQMGAPRSTFAMRLWHHVIDLRLRPVVPLVRSLRCQVSETRLTPTRSAHRSVRLAECALTPPAALVLSVIGSSHSFSLPVSCPGQAGLIRSPHKRAIPFVRLLRQRRIVLMLRWRQSRSLEFDGGGEMTDEKLERRQREREAMRQAIAAYTGPITKCPPGTSTNVLPRRRTQENAQVRNSEIRSD